MTQQSPADIVIVLSHELACSLEMNFEPHEIKQLWPEAMAGLGSASRYLTEQGLPTPEVVEHLLDRVKGA